MIITLRLAIFDFLRSVCLAICFSLFSHLFQILSQLGELQKPEFNNGKSKMYYSFVEP